ncbi:MAG: hypothetical protein QOC78_1582 [Solirubrobacteraceae bacterium]|nr:hypothetical protein [Solirubrobacteraceae bacterium]
MTRGVQKIGVAAALAVAALAPAAHAAAPKVDLLVAFRDGSAKQARVTASATTAKLGARRCAVGQGTPLAALLRARIGPIKLKDYGSCSRRPADAAGLYVRSIRADRARGSDGWVYKVGTKTASAGAADPSGPFGRGRLRRDAIVTWFYCHMNASTGSCQRTLLSEAQDLGGGMLGVTVRAFDDRGRARPAAGATVHAGDVTGTTGDDGVARFAVPPGKAFVYAELKGAVRSFGRTVASK